MTCPLCDKWAPSDPETGYDVDEVCPECRLWLELSEGDDYYVPWDIEWMAADPKDEK